MDTVKFDIALSRHPPRQILTPASATVPSIGDEISVSNMIKSDEPELKVPAASGNISPVSFGPSNQSFYPPTKPTLADRFHDWMEMDMEHGL